MASSRKRARGHEARISADDLTLNTWVLVAPSQKHVKVADRAMRETPALLVSKADEAGCVTVAYPNQLVLRHHFKGSALLLKQVPISDLRRYEGSKADEANLTAALKAMKAERQKDKDSESEAENDSESEAEDVLPATPQAATERSAPVTLSATPAACTASTGELLASPESMMPREACAAPCTPLRQAPPTPSGLPKVPDDSPAPKTPLRAQHTMLVSPSPPKMESMSKERLVHFTQMVSKSFRRLREQASPKRMTKQSLAEELEAEFAPWETDQGLAKLEEKNKIFVCGEVIFRT